AFGKENHVFFGYGPALPGHHHPRPEPGRMETCRKVNQKTAKCKQKAKKTLQKITNRPRNPQTCHPPPPSSPTAAKGV
ncbi:MAG: hypothetical protein PUE10_07880, partial [Bacteroidales bacterium]|nr:hypothetical protein [Bacteroidales bacterium]